MKKDAVFSSCKNYRYALWRIWDDSKPYAMFIGLNPTAADEKKDNPTIRRCMNFAKDWGYGGLCMTNLFAYLATIPANMMAADNPVGSENDAWLTELAKTAGVIIAAWGNDGAFLGRSRQVLKLITDVKCLKVNKSGEPAHPLYQPRSAMPVMLAS